jgi:type IV pilus assembly protein PilM
MFSLGKEDVLGIDFGASAIKAVELSVSDKEIALKSFAEVSLHSIEDGLPEGVKTTYDEQLGLLLRALLRKMSPDVATALVTLPANIGLVSFAKFPYLESEELAEAVQFEARKYIPSDLNDVILNWEILSSEAPSDENPAGSIKVVLIAVVKAEVERYSKYITDTGLNIRFMEIEIFSLARALSRGNPGTRLIIDIGSKVTNLVVATNSSVQANSTVNIGGNDITHTIADVMNIGLERADELKKGNTDFLHTTQSKITFPALETIAAEAQRLLETFHAKNSGQVCQEVVLSGGGSRLTGIDAFFEEKVGKPVIFGKPWVGIKIPDTIVHDDYLDTEYNVALGVALAYQEALQKEKQKKAAKNHFWSLLNKKI